MDRLQRVRVVLCEPSHPGNIGAVARAMKTMGLSDLVLAGGASHEADEAVARAAGAASVLQAARRVADVDEAIADRTFVIGASARRRNRTLPVATPRAAAARALIEAGHQRVAVLFGPEASGLTNEALARCHLQLTIPAAEDYGSLNLAMAVQIVCYELRLAALAGSDAVDVEAAPAEGPLATADELEGLYGHLERTLITTGFLPADHPGNVMTRLRRLYGRTRLEAAEVHLLRGVLKSVEKW